METLVRSGLAYSAPSPLRPMTDTADNNKPSKVTVVDVARLAGVSAMTVSRVLNTPDSVPAPTVQRVREAVDQLGYVRNRLAGSLRSARSQLVAAVVPTLSGPIFLESIDALNAGLARRGYHLIVAQGGYADHDRREDELLSDLLSRRPDALVLTGTLHSAQAKRRLLSAGIPVLEIWDLSNDPIDMLIGFSHEAVGAAVAQQFQAGGRRRLALIGGDDARSQRRWASFRQRALDLGLDEPHAEFVPAPARLGDGRRALRRLLQARPGVDALFCSSDMMAAGVLIEAQAQGLAVPGRLAVVGFGDLNFAADLEPALSTVRIDAQRIGELAAETLVRRLGGQALPQRIVDVGFELVRRASG